MGVPLFQFKLFFSEDCGSILSNNLRKNMPHGSKYLAGAASSNLEESILCLFTNLDLGSCERTALVIS